MELDENYEPNCKQCIEVYGFTHVLPQNELALEIYYLLNSPLGRDLGFGTVIWQEYEPLIALHGRGKMLSKLELISSMIKRFSDEKQLQEMERVKATKPQNHMNIPRPSVGRFR